MSCTFPRLGVAMAIGSILGGSAAVWHRVQSSGGTMESTTDYTTTTHSTNWRTLLPEGISQVQLQKPMGIFPAGFRRSNDYVPRVIELTAEDFDDEGRPTPRTTDVDTIFIDFDAPWCVWCQRLLPIWETFAWELEERGQSKHFAVAHIDCTKNLGVCKANKIMAFPTLRLFRKGVAVYPDYKGGRNIADLMEYSEKMILEGNKDNAIAWKDDNDRPNGGEPNHQQQNSSSEDDDEEKGDPEEGEDDDSFVCKRYGFRYGTPTKWSETSSDDSADEYNDKERKEFDTWVAPECQSQQTNPRGTYSSFYSPCKFVFHDNNKNDGETSAAAAEFDTSAFHLSNACTNNNVVQAAAAGGDESVDLEPVYDYVRDWPDECVGDFSRCYDLSKEREIRIVYPHFCAQKWRTPKVATHVSVSCVADKDSAVEERSRRRSGGGGDAGDSRSGFFKAKMEQDEKHHREKVQAVLFAAGLLICCGWSCLLSVYRFVFLPYLRAMKRSKSDPDLQSLLAATTEDGEKKDGEKDVKV